jgi:uncharacterized protein YabE (DUF348 family)
LTALIGRLVASRIALVATATVAILAVAGTTFGYQALSTTVTLNVDGEDREVRVLGAKTVDDVLASAGIELTSRDVVVPSLDSEVSDDTRVAVRFSRPVELTVDGETDTHWVTATDVDGALAQIGRTFNNGKLSLSRSDSIDRGGVELDVVTAKRLTVALEGEEPRDVRVAAMTVEEALDELGVKLGKRDRVSPELTDELERGMTITYDKVRVRRVEVEDESYTAKEVRRNNADLNRGTTRVVEEGEAGVRNATYRVTRVNGEITKRELIESTVITEAKPRVVEVGTKTAPQPAPNYASGSTVWDRLAQCESGGNWSINTGNGYYGGLQFSLSTWRSVGGTGYPHQHSRAEQINRGQILQARAGWGQWPSCSRQLGLR